MTDRSAVEEWVAGYERAWRTPGTGVLDALFTETVTYVPAPWSTPVVGHAALREFWDAARTGADEGFHMTSEVVTVAGDLAVVRVHVDYDDGQRWRDLWLLTLDDEGRCAHFEEWPFTEDQDDGHEDDHA